MKVMLLVAFLASVAIAVPQKRIIFGSGGFHFDSGAAVVKYLERLLHLDQVKQLVVDLLDEMGSDENEVTCERDCSKIVTTYNDPASTLATLETLTCPVICHGFQELVHYFHLTPPSTTLAPGVTASPVHGNGHA